MYNRHKRYFSVECLCMWNTSIGTKLALFSVKNPTSNLVAGPRREQIELRGAYVPLSNTSSNKCRNLAGCCSGDDGGIESKVVEGRWIAVKLMCGYNVHNSVAAITSVTHTPVRPGDVGMVSVYVSRRRLEGNKEDYSRLVISTAYISKVDKILCLMPPNEHGVHLASLSAL